MRLAIPCLLLLAACAAAPAGAPVYEAGSPEAEVTAAQARMATLPACHPATAEAFAANAGSTGASTMNNFSLQVSGAASQSVGCAGFGDDNACTVQGEAWIKASVPGRTRYWHVPAGAKAELLSSATDVRCGLSGAGA